MNAYPEPTVGALIFNPDGQLLLVKTFKWKDHFVIPGGHIELGERIEDACRREVKEETGLDVYDLKLLGIQECVYDKSFHEKKHFIFIDFVCKTDSTNVVINEEHQDFKWVYPEEIDQYNIEGFTKKLLTEFFKGGKSQYNCNILYKYYSS